MCSVRNEPTTAKLLYLAPFAEEEIKNQRGYTPSPRTHSSSAALQKAGYGAPGDYDADKDLCRNWAKTKSKQKQNETKTNTEQTRNKHVMGNLVLQFE